jgi:hypothetical protein
MTEKSKKEPRHIRWLQIIVIAVILGFACVGSILLINLLVYIM